MSGFRISPTNARLRSRRKREDHDNQSGTAPPPSSARYRLAGNAPRGGFTTSDKTSRGAVLTPWKPALALAGSHGTGISFADVRKTGIGHFKVTGAIGPPAAIHNASRKGPERAATIDAPQIPGLAPKPDPRSNLAGAKVEPGRSGSGSGPIHIGGRFADAPQAVVPRVEIIRANAKAGARFETNSAPDGADATPLLVPGRCALRSTGSGSEAHLRPYLQLRTNPQRQIDTCLEQ
jgi:hypothetical protein